MVRWSYHHLGHVFLYFTKNTRIKVEEGAKSLVFGGSLVFVVVVVEREKGGGVGFNL